MLTRITIRNFKKFRNDEIELGNPVVFIGPNNSGKTTALQALAFWDIGLKRWVEKRGTKEAPGKRPGVTINRRDLLAVPVPSANLLWKDLHVREALRVDGKQQTKNIRIEIIVCGINNGEEWTCGLEFDYANEESFYIRPLRLSSDPSSKRMPIPDAVLSMRIAYLPPMSGLSSTEDRLDPGAINVRLGEGRTAEVLRNLCYQVASSQDSVVYAKWESICKKIHALFGVLLDKPKYITERGEITMTYHDATSIRLDLSSSGRGLQQTLLLLTHMAVNPGSVLLLDEPDAHLEILRQRQIYQVLSDSADIYDSQLVVASHSEIILNEAADRDVVVAFVGRPHRIDDRGSQVLKSLKEIGFDQYYQAEQNGWVLYIEGSTDLAHLRAFACKLGHRAETALERPFIHYVENKPARARDHFFGLREAKPDLVGLALFDRIPNPLRDTSGLMERMWARREIENYLCTPETLLAWANQNGKEFGGGPLFSVPWESVMREAVQEIEAAMKTLGKGSPWNRDTKVTDEFLDPLFVSFFGKLNLPNLMRKTNYHSLVEYVPNEQIDSEISEILDLIDSVASAANPVEPPGPDVG